MSLLGGLFGVRVGAWSEPLTTAALGIIAYLIGGAITVGQLRRMSGIILGSTFGESLGAVTAVFLAMLLVLPEGLGGLPAAVVALAFAAIAAPTAPAATITVLHQYHARGTLSSTLLGVVTLDDAVGIVLFALLAVATTAASIAQGLGGAVEQNLGSVVLGLAVGYPPEPSRRSAAPGRSASTARDCGRAALDRDRRGPRPLVVARCNDFRLRLHGSARRATVSSRRSSISADRRDRRQCHPREHPSV